jgi:cysteine desulfurase
LIKLDENEIAMSTGSACTSNKKQKASHVLKALGLSHQEITGSIRISLGYQNTIEELDTAITKLKEIVSELRRINEFEMESNQNNKTKKQHQMKVFKTK